MNNVHYMTLAATRTQDPLAFDSVIKQAWREAAEIVGKDVVMRAVYSAPSEEKISKAA